MPPSATPFLRWAGSKRQLIPQLRSYWRTDHRRYIEPFMGSACLFFALSPEEAILGDVNRDLVDVYRTVRDHPRAVYNALLKLPKGKRWYYRIRKQGLPRSRPIQRTARFIYLNRYCFNGLYRTNRAGAFNVPYSGARTGPLPTLLRLQTVARSLASADIRCADFADVLGSIEDGDFVYLDPPFAVSNRRVFRQYDPSSFGQADLFRLADSLKQIDARGATFLVSYAVCREALHAFSRWHVRRVFTQRNISGFAKHRRRAVELLVSNKPCPCDCATTDKR